MALNAYPKQIRRLLLLFTVLFVAAPLFAQAEEPPDVDLVTSGLIAIGMALQAGGVWFLVQLVKKYLPSLKERSPQFIPIIALLAGPVLDFLASWLSGVLLTTIDFGSLSSAITEIVGGFSILGGAPAVVGDQFFRQRAKGKR